MWLKIECCRHDVKNVQHLIILRGRRRLNIQQYFNIVAMVVLHINPSPLEEKTGTDWV